MKLKVKYFGALAEETGTSEEELELEGDFSDVETLKRILETKHTGITTLSYQVSVNRTLSSNAEVKEGDEVAFLPPFAGG